MVKLYKIESGACAGMECVKSSDYQDVAESHVLLKADYEQLQQERDQLLKDIDELRRGAASLREYADSQQRVCIQVMEERDALAAYCEELKRHVHHASEYGDWTAERYWIVPDGWFDHADKLLNKSPQTCLAERDARVVEAAADYLNEYEIDPHGANDKAIRDLEQYAQQLKDKADDH